MRCEAIIAIKSQLCEKDLQLVTTARYKVVITTFKVTVMRKLYL